MKRAAILILTAIMAISLITPAGASAANTKAPAKFTIYHWETETAQIKKLKVWWEKQKSVSGYQIEYSTNKSFNKSKKLTVKKNGTWIKNLTPNTKYYIKARGYKTSNGKKVYGAWSKRICIKTRQTELKLAKQAFKIQNEYRNEKGVKSLKWSNALYKIAKIRAKQISTNYAHDTSDIKYANNKVLGNLAEVTLRKQVGSGTYGYPLGLLEGNIANGQSTPEEVMLSWKKSSGHYANMIVDSDNYGAIACYRTTTGRYYWVSIFCDVDLDKVVIYYKDTLNSDPTITDINVADIGVDFSIE